MTRFHRPVWIIAICIVLGSLTAPSALAQLGSSTSISPPTMQTNVKPRWVLREGTTVGPITGRLALGSNVWRFIPDEVNTPVDESELGQSGSAGLVPDGARQAVDGMARQSMLTKSSPTPSNLKSVEKPTGAPEVSPAVVAALTSIPVIENLMLQRIVASIEENPTDARWTITGTVTEFRDENRLMLKTIQRAPAIDPSR